MSGLVRLARDVWHVWIASIVWFCYLLARWSGVSVRWVMSGLPVMTLFAWFVWYVLFGMLVTLYGLRPDLIP